MFCYYQRVSSQGSQKLLWSNPGHGLRICILIVFIHPLVSFNQSGLHHTISPRQLYVLRERERVSDSIIRHQAKYRPITNQLFTSVQHLLLLIIGLHVSTDHSVIFRSLICCMFQGAVHTFGIPIVFTLKLNHSLA